ncbi:hypothetical protein Tco_0821449 [Tanacetum coccineum]|uniref:Uncharacterized protein n=1 Tax=Tanacetum coccineum TaxID=301880 RepID=A0ABQ5ACA6_9ASTR
MKRKETLPIVFLASELSSLYPASYKGKENGVNILKSIDEGPFQMGTTRDILAEGTEAVRKEALPKFLLISELSNTLLSELISRVTGLLKDFLQRVKADEYREKRMVNILKSIDEGPFQMGTTRDTLDLKEQKVPNNLVPNELESIRIFTSEDKKKYINLTLRATNILLQGLPKDIYTLINHYTDAKDIWIMPHSKELHSAQATTELRILQRQDVVDVSSGEWGSTG